MIEHEYGRVVHHGGRTFLATETMAEIFAAAAADIVARGDTELVPLLHRGGVDLLLVGPLTPIAVTRIEIGRAPKPPVTAPAKSAEAVSDADADAEKRTAV
ncbi:hypothetical protein NVV95_10500 [Herbiconiux sp. CPCC 205716]|uniref:Uncharacterized protein n=1 Tax=Herbiconiux gentiana TaxID=2970912 RepID=A0ABT2GFW0_9MICO|nr:hypothetical protein [Herbiconiux gentiana]MCS5714981.1 hypothetical protein [Herbiconiux gentiana]